MSNSTETQIVVEKNEICRNIFQSMGKEYGDDNVDGEELEKNYEKARKYRDENNAVFIQLKNARNLELCFLLDVTGSMSPYIKETCERIQDIVSDLTTPNKITSQKGQTSLIRLALVAYRDFGDDPEFEIHLFSSSVEDFQNFAGKLQAMGGGDLPENVFGGFEKALNLDWKDEYDTKVIFHIADAPCHGTIYHGEQQNMFDDYPNYDSVGKIVKRIFDGLRNKKIQYHFGKIQKDTDKMIQKFGQLYGRGIDNFDIKDVTNMRKCVLAAVNKSVLSTIYFVNKKYGLLEDYYGEFKIDKSEPNWRELETLEGNILSYTEPISFKDIENFGSLSEKSVEPIMFRIAILPYANFDGSLVYYGKNLTTKNKKEENVIFKEYPNSHFQTRPMQFYKTQSQISIITKFMANLFNQKLEKAEEDGLNFLESKILKYQTKEGETKIMLMQDRIPESDGKLITFSKQGVHPITEEVAREKRIDPKIIQKLAAFSHFTFKETDGYFLITDFQGIKASFNNKLFFNNSTIHCKDSLRFGDKNGGKNGMDLFFHRHLCNHYCSKLGLEPEINR